MRAQHTVDLEKAVRMLVIPFLGRCTYSTMYSDNFADRVGETVYSAVKASFNGRLVFVPSYKFLRHLQERWTGTGFISPFRSLGLRVVFEPPDSRLFRQDLDTFRAASRSSRGAALFAVYRGKAAEGIDFTDHMARLVICVGIPYRALNDERTVAKKEFNDQYGVCSGDEWYLTDAIIAVNQALGRCIRHKDVYGALMLIDERWEAESFRSRLPRWLSSSFRSMSNSNEVTAALVSFFAPYYSSIKQS